ncbi:MAG: glycogen debranching N-terminal domain-containing protein [Chloroflexota bacterium]|nr:glycogen debranching N-terminal domain-containing protein [Chloroflexota bacterium]
MRRHVLKENDLVMVSDELGDMARSRRRLGLYWRDTRHLSILETTVGGLEPRLLTSSSEENYICDIQIANPTIELHDGAVALARSVSIRRSRYLKHGLHECISFYNYNPFPASFSLAIIFGSDFLDILEVRGWRREKRGDIRQPQFADSRLTLSYVGLDEVERRTEVVFEVDPSNVETDVCVAEPLLTRPSTRLPGAVEPAIMTLFRPACARVTWEVSLPPGASKDIAYHVLVSEDGEVAEPEPYGESLECLRQSYDDWHDNCTWLCTDNELFNQLLNRSSRDLRLLGNDTPEGSVPAAGIPWFAVVFARDALITSLQTLMLNPQIAVATLRFLAKYQGTKADPWRDEEPGKILHVFRTGEMTRAGEVPYDCYYGSLDATPLFLIAFAETMRWLDDDSLYHELLPTAKKALAWMEHHGDICGDGYLSYLCRSAGGMRDQGWKDSRGALSHADGRAVEPPVSPVEVQGYAYRAMKEMAVLLRRKGETALPARLEKKAAALKERFNREFWLEDKRIFAQALDADRKPVEVLTSNPGHCLFCDIVDEEKARYLVLRLTSAEMASGWGIRTVSNRETKFNPMSYQNGSIWPHDNSIIVAGMKRYGYAWEVEHIATQLFDASRFFPYGRLPQLYCGFTRDREGFSTPASYPVSPSPQAWAAGSTVLLLQSLLGLQVDAHSRRIYVTPKLPPWLREASVSGLRVGGGTVDLFFARHDEETSFRITKNEADVEVVIPPP